MMCESMFQQLEICQKQRDVARSEMARVQKISDNYYALCVDREQDLAALREELADCAIKRDAAEQRNAELLELLRDAACAVKDHAMTAWAVPLYIRISKALAKPTESGASEADRKADDEALQRRHDQERQEYFNNDQ